MVDCRLLGGLGSVWPFFASCCGTLSVDAFLTREINAFRTVSMNREPLLPEADTSLVVGLTGQIVKPEFPRVTGPPRKSLVLVCNSSVRDSNKADLVRSWKLRELTLAQYSSSHFQKIIVAAIRYRYMRTWTLSSYVERRKQKDGKLKTGKLTSNLENFSAL